MYWPRTNTLKRYGLLKNERLCPIFAVRFCLQLKKIGAKLLLLNREKKMSEDNTQYRFIVAPLNARFQFGESAPMPRHNGIAEDATPAAPKAQTQATSTETIITRPRGLHLPHGA
jgi:hypothetical protein